MLATHASVPGGYPGAVDITARVPLGSQGLVVSPQGLGCMGMTGAYGRPDEGECLATIRRALDEGLTFLDTADVYGAGANERLLGKALRGRREEVVVASKFGFAAKPDGTPTVRGDPPYVRQACDASLQRLGTDYIDLYYQHRVDRSTAIEDTASALAELVEAGKVRYVGLSEASPATIRRAHAIHPVTAVQTEYSLWTRDPEDEVLPVVRELGIGFVAYSPLGRGFLGGGITTARDLGGEMDGRLTHPRFQGDNFARNLASLARLNELAHDKGVTPAQLALAWVASQGADVVPIPGSKRRSHLEENLASLEVELTGEDEERLEWAFPKGETAGQRYPDMSQIDA